MPTSYIPASEHVQPFLDQALAWHPDLAKAGVKVGALFAMSACDTQPALKEHGYPVVGQVKIVPAKDRLSKGYDAELVLDYDEWKRGATGHRVACIDHFLQRLEVRRPKPKKAKRRGPVAQGTAQEQEQHQEAEFLFDVQGRPLLKMRPGDWYAGVGFREVVLRHGGFAPERALLERAWALSNTPAADAPAPGP